MRVCVDTNVFLRIFSPSSPFPKIRDALLRGRFSILISNEILLEYREVIERRSRTVRWADFAQLIETLEQLHGNVVEITPQFRFLAIAEDPDDNKFSDCAIVGDAEYIVTYDRAFEALKNSGYKPRAINPDDFAALF